MKNTLLNKLTTNSNNVGVVIFCLGTLTNDDIDYGRITKEYKIETINHLRADLEKFSPLPNPSLSLISERNILDEEQIIVEFASKLLGSSKDIEPEIAQVVQKHFWDMI